MLLGSFVRADEGKDGNQIVFEKELSVGVRNREKVYLSQMLCV